MNGRLIKQKSMSTVLIAICFLFSSRSLSLSPITLDHLLIIKIFCVIFGNEGISGLFIWWFPFRFASFHLFNLLVQHLVRGLERAVSYQKCITIDFLCYFFSSFWRTSTFFELLRNISPIWQHLMIRQL